MKVKYLVFGVFLMIVAGVACNNQGDGEEQANTSTETEELTEAEKKQYKKQGKEIAQATFNTLSSHLKSAMKEGGVQQAVQYCNVAAYPLTDSLSKVHNAEIRRTALKYRNPKNKPNGQEEEVLELYKSELAKGNELEAIVTKKEEQVHFYAPIMTKALCLNCHGDIETQITKENYTIIRELYPEDMATGFKTGELRGIWSITFKNQNNGKL